MLQARSSRPDYSLGETGFELVLVWNRLSALVNPAVVKLAVPSHISSHTKATSNHVTCAWAHTRKESYQQKCFCPADFLPARVFQSSSL